MFILLGRGVLSYDVDLSFLIHKTTLVDVEPRYGTVKMITFAR